MGSGVPESGYVCEGWETDKIDDLIAMDEYKIKKGQHILTVKIQNDKGESIFGLDKIPLESLYKMALEQIGEQESYIEELEEKMRVAVDERKTIRQEERIALMREIQKEAVVEAKKTQHVQSLEKRLSKQGETIKRLYESRNELFQEIARLNKLLESNAQDISA